MGFSPAAGLGKTSAIDPNPSDEMTDCQDQKVDVIHEEVRGHPPPSTSICLISFIKSRMLDLPGHASWGTMLPSPGPCGMNLPIRDPEIPWRSLPPVWWASFVRP